MTKRFLYAIIKVSKCRKQPERKVVSRMTIKGFTIEGLPFVFETLEQAGKARFPTKLAIEKYEEEEEAE